MLVLNASYEPINVCNVRRATVLVLKERAEIIERGEGALHSERLDFDRPCVIRLIRYIRIPRDVHRRKITRKAVLARDAWTCQYCGHQATGLTVDHVIPRSRGGESVWENIVASCAPCNRKKGNLTPREARDAPAPAARGRRARPCSSASPARGSRSPGSRTWWLRVQRRAAPRGGPSSKVRLEDELGIVGGAGRAPHLPRSPVPGVDSAGRPARPS